ncbi:MAG: hypothetical protein IJQ91_03225 [Acidaminococcaceae bacterium]|nr:hypothetical protein [Acidaminococcaceae bacterium]
MTQSRSVCSRIRNAKASLENAERSFRSHQEVRGELDLMLAEAELDNLRQKRPGISWTRHTLAACFAVLVLASGCLGWWWASAYGGNTTNAAGLQGTPVTAELKEPADADKQMPAVRPNGVTSAAVPEKKSGVKKKPDAPVQVATPKLQQPVNRDGGVRLSAGQMRQLIRSGKQELENMR